MREVHRGLGLRRSRYAWLLSLPLALACGGGGSGSSGGPSGPTGPTGPTGSTGPDAPWLGSPATALTANPGLDRSVEGGAHVTLDATPSRSPAGSIVSWTWAQTGGPAVTLTGAATARPSFDAPVVDGTGALLTFTLTVGDGAATAQATHRVSVHRPTGTTPTSSIGKVARAMREGILDHDTAVQYLAFALFKDARLPAQYQGTTSPRSGSWAMHVLGNEYPSLSDAARAVVLPFLLPPGHPQGRSHLMAQARSARRAVGAAVIEHLVVEGPHVAVWYWSDLPSGATTATALLAEIESVIWPRLQSVWTPDHMPLNADGGVTAFRGIHGKVNVFLDPVVVSPSLADAYGYENSYGPAPAPVYVVIQEDLPFTGKPGLIETAAHELTHACQDSFEQSERYAARRFLYEGIATWAEDDVYPTHNSEHATANQLLEHLDLPIDDETDDHPYGTYLFFQWATSGGDRDLVRRTFANFKTKDSIAALDAAFPSYAGIVWGLEYQWGSFLDAIWNREPTEGYWGVDGLTLGAKTAEATRTLDLTGVKDRDYLMSADVEYLASKFHHFTVDPSVRTIHFFDGLTFDVGYQTSDGTTVLLAGNATADQLKGATTRMLVKRGGKWSAIGPTSAAAGNLSFCQDDPADEVQEIAVAFGDSLPRRGHSKRPLGFDPLLWTTNLGCNQWDGSVSAHTSPSVAGTVPSETVTASNVIFAPYLPGGIKTGSLMFEVFSADLTWEISGTVGSCTYSGNHSWTAGPTAFGPSGMLTFAPTVVLGKAYRAYTGGASSADVLLPYTVTCDNGDGSQTVTSETKSVDWLAFDSAADPEWRPTVSDDGATAAGTADDGQMVYTWSFTTKAGLAAPLRGLKGTPAGRR